MVSGVNDSNGEVPSSDGVRGWFQPGGVFGPILGLLTGSVAGAAAGATLGILAGVLLDLSVVTGGAVAGAVVGASVGLRGWWLDRSKGNGWTVDPWSDDG